MNLTRVENTKIKLVGRFAARQTVACCPSIRMAKVFTPRKNRKKLNGERLSSIESIMKWWIGMRKPLEGWTNLEKLSLIVWADVIGV